MLSTKEKLRAALKFKPSLEAFIYVEFMNKKLSKLPWLEIAEDDVCYTDGQKIHLGVGQFEAEDEHDLFWQMYYVLGHELQHVKSTVQYDWTAAIQRGTRHVCIEMSKAILGKPVRLTKDSDYERFMQDMRSKGYYVSLNRIQQCVHFICNSLEDGRIEGIRCDKHYAFQKYMVAYRAKEWEKTDITVTSVRPDENGNVPSAADMSAAQKLSIVSNQILSLATSRIYQKGFLRYYGNSELEDYIKQFYEPIKAAIASPRCRGCMDHAVKITESLTPLIIEASKLSEFETMLAKLLEQMASSAASTYSATSNDEEVGDGIVIEVFGRDDMQEKTGKGSAGKPGEEDESSDQNSKAGKSDDRPETGQDEQKDSAGSAEAQKNSEGEEPQDGSDGSDGGQESAKEDGSAGGQKGAADSDAAGSEDGADSNSGSGEDAGSNKDGDSSGREDSDSKPKKRKDGEADPTKTSGNSESGLGNEPSGQASKGSGQDADADAAAEAVRKAMEEAANASDTEWSVTQEDIQKQKEFTDKMKSFASQTPKPIDTSGINSNYTDDVTFQEVVRQYHPDLMLPMELCNKGEALKRKIMDVLKRQKDPDKRGMRTGRVDAGRLHTLIFSDTSCFKRQGEEKKPNAAAFLLQDNSGSMGSGVGSNRYYCCNAFAIVEHAFSDIMPVKIAAFDAHGVNFVTHEVIKEFDEKASCNFSYNFLQKGRTGGGNKDGYSIRVATQQLLARPEQDKILIIASDGMPTAYYSDAEADVKAAVEEARRAGVLVIGMYMYRDQEPDDAAMFQEMYAPNYLVVELDSLEEELARVMRLAFFKK